MMKLVVIDVESINTKENFYMLHNVLKDLSEKDVEIGLTARKDETLQTWMGYFDKYEINPYLTFLKAREDSAIPNNGSTQIRDDVAIEDTYVFSNNNKSVEASKQKGVNATYFENISSLATQLKQLLNTIVVLPRPVDLEEESEGFKKFYSGYANYCKGLDEYATKYMSSPQQSSRGQANNFKPDSTINRADYQPLFFQEGNSILLKSIPTSKNEPLSLQRRSSTFGENRDTFFHSGQTIISRKPDNMQPMHAASFKLF